MNGIIGDTNICLNESQGESKTNEPLYIRVLRKKYKCFILWLFLFICLVQLLYIIIDKIDNKMLENLLSKYLDISKNSTFCKSSDE